MKFLLTAILLAATAFGQASSPAAGPQSIPVDQENANKARALLEQAIQALGGQYYLSIQDVSTQGRIYSFYHGRPNSYGVVYWGFYKYPDQERIEFTKKRDVAYVFNGDKAYEITYKGTAAMDPKEASDAARRRHYALDQVLREWIHQPGMALFYNGSSVAADKPAEQVELLNSHNEGVIIDIDANTHLPLKRTYTWRDPTDRERNTESEVYDNYRPVQGIMTPYSVTRFYNGDMSAQRFLNSVSYNQGVKDSLFEAQVTYDPNKPAEPKK